MKHNRNDGEKESRKEKKLFVPNRLCVQHALSLMELTLFFRWLEDTDCTFGIPNFHSLDRTTGLEFIH